MFSPNFRGGLRAGDIVTDINGQTVTSSTDIYKSVDKGEPMTLTVKRHTQTLKLQVTPVEVK